MTEREQIGEFIDSVCEHIRCREVHAEVREELHSHIDEIIESYVAGGRSEADAVDAALHDMGSSAAIGRGLHRAHRPRTDWVMIACLVVCAAAGLFTTWSLSGSQNTTLEQGLFARKAIWTGVGFAAAATGALVDYRIIRSSSRYLFWSTMLITVLTMVFGTSLLGRKALIVGGVDVDVMGISPFLLLIALPEMMRAGKSALKNRSLTSRRWLGVALYIVPMWCFVESAAMPSAIVYSAGFAGLLLARAENRKQRLQILTSIPLFILCSAFIWVESSPMMYRLQRLQGYLHPNRYAKSYSYEFIQGRHAIQTAGPWGHGFHVSLPYLPFPQSTEMLSYFTFSFGWIAAAGVVLVMLGLLYRVYHVVRKTRDGYGATLVVTLGAAIGIQIIYAILMAFGALPLMGVNMPLLASDGTVSIVQFFVFGIMLSVYRRRGQRSECELSDIMVL